MDIMLIAALGTGILVGLGLWVMLSLLVPGRVDLVDALTRDRASGRLLAAPRRPDVTDDRRPLERIQARLELQLAKSRLATPDADLRVIEMTRGEFLFLRIGVAAGGLLVGAIYLLLFAAFDAGIPPVFPVGLGIVVAIIGWIAVGSIIHGRAEERRREMRYALVSYFTLLALHRASGEGMASALEMTAASSQAWTFRRIEQRVSSSLRTGGAAWDGLAKLAIELGIDELADLSSIADAAGTQGAGIYSTLLARAKALRNELLNYEESAALVASSRMVIPKALLGIVTLIFLLYPAVMKLAGS